MQPADVGEGVPCFYISGDAGSIPEPGRSLENEMATHSSILSWRISWAEEPGRLESMGLQRVEHN